MKDNITKEDLRKALIGISLSEANKQKYRNAQQIKKALGFKYTRDKRITRGDVKCSAITQNNA